MRCDSVCLFGSCVDYKSCMLKANGWGGLVFHDEAQCVGGDEGDGVLERWW